MDSKDLRTVVKITPALLLAGLIVAPSVYSRQVESNEQCLLRLVSEAGDEMSVGEIRKQCQLSVSVSDETSIISASDSPASDTLNSKPRRFGLIPYKANYVLPYSYSWDPEGSAIDARDEGLDNEEVKFQFSLQVPIFTDISPINADLYFAYTQLSLWQAYNNDISSSFREINFEPEMFITAENDMKLLGFTNIRNSLGIVHQSNGRAGSSSRSWDRLYLQMMFERGNFTWSIKPWWRIPESSKNSPTDVSGDDNPDIEHFMGHFEWTGIYQWNDHNLSLLVRNNLQSEGKGALEFGWSFPVSDNIRLYVQYFTGYGESLINYDNNTNRLGIGFEITDWL